jgi:hypothetical protein
LRHARGPEQHVDLVLGDEAARVAGGLHRVGGVVEHDHVELVSGDALRPQRERRLLRQAERRQGPRERQVDADRDVGVRLDARGREGPGGEQAGDGEFHGGFLRRDRDGVRA